MKKAGIIIPIILVVLLFVAVIVVAKIDVLQTTDIVLDEGYTKYEQLKNENLLDDNNQHIIDYSKSDKVCVSFAENKLMEVEYYLDEAYTNKIDETAYLMPGDTIYFKYIGAKANSEAWYKIIGTGVFTVDMALAEIIVDEERNYILIRVPQPTLQPNLFNVKMEEFHFDSRGFEGIAVGGALAAKAQMEGCENIKNKILASQAYYDCAKSAAVAQLVKMAEDCNPDIKIKVDVEFFDMAAD